MGSQDGCDRWLNGELQEAARSQIGKNWLPHPLDLKPIVQAVKGPLAEVQIAPSFCLEAFVRESMPVVWIMKRVAFSCFHYSIPTCL